MILFVFISLLSPLPGVRRDSWLGGWVGVGGDESICNIYSVGSWAIMFNNYLHFISDNIFTNSKKYPSIVFTFIFIINLNMALSERK